VGIREESTGALEVGGRIGLERVSQLCKTMNIRLRRGICRDGRDVSFFMQEAGSSHA